MLFLLSWMLFPNCPVDKLAIPHLSLSLISNAACSLEPSQTPAGSCECSSCAPYCHGVTGHLPLFLKVTLETPSFSRFYFDYWWSSPKYKIVYSISWSLFHFRQLSLPQCEKITFKLLFSSFQCLIFILLCLALIFDYLYISKSLYFLMHQFWQTCVWLHTIRWGSGPCPLLSVTPCSLKELCQCRLPPPMCKNSRWDSLHLFLL